MILVCIHDNYCPASVGLSQKMYLRGLVHIASVRQLLNLLMSSHFKQ